VVGIGKAIAVIGLALSESGNTTGESFTVNVSDSNGLLSATGTGVTGTGTMALTISGSLAQVNADLATLTDTDAVAASDTITLTATDNFGNSATPATVAIQVVGQNDTLTAAPTTIVGTAANDTITATNSTLISRDHIDGGGGTNTLVLSGSGSFDLGAPAQLINIQQVSATTGQAPASGGGAGGVQTVYLRDGLNVTLNVAAGVTAAGNTNPQTITIYGGADSSVINLGGGVEDVVLGSATETVTASATGTAFIQGLSSQAGSLIVGSSQASTSLEITDTGGTAVLNAADSNLTVKLDGATNLMLNKMQFITADGSVGGSTITALATNQTLLGGAGDTLIGSTAYGDFFEGSSALLNQDIIQNFGGSDQIDLTDILASKVTGLNWIAGNGGGILSLTDGTHSVALNLLGAYTASSFAFKTDGAIGTLITYT
jgi:hypothetical protein